MKKKLILIGSGGHAISCIDVVELENKFNIFGLISEDNSKVINGYKIIGSDKDLKLIRKKIDYALIGIGQITNSLIRKNLFNLLKKYNYKLPTIVSPKSYVSKKSTILEGSIVMHNALVNSHAKIGKNCIINSNAIIEHNAVIGDNCHISTGAVINGNCKISKNTFIGSNSTLHHDIQIKANSIIPAGSVIKKNI